MRRPATWLIAIALGVALRAQTPAFEVVSVKPSDPKSTGGGRLSGPGPSAFSMVNIPLRMLLTEAFGVRDNKLMGAPEWTRTEKFDINATYPAGADRQTQYRPMVQQLLADHFGMTAHRETREIPVYRLVKARTDGRLGPQIAPSTIDCAAFRSGDKSQLDAGGASPVTPSGKRFACMMMASSVYITGSAQTLAAFAESLATRVDRPVVDATGLTGLFDLDVAWSPAPGTAPADPSLPDRGSIFTAVQEQLGLRLEPGRDRLEVVVIDAIRRPSAN